MEKMKPAIWACILFIPVLAGVAWISDIITRGLFAAVIGLDEPLPPIWPDMVWPLAIMWLVCSAIVLLMAWSGLGAPPRMAPPPPPSFKGDEQ